MRAGVLIVPCIALTAGITPSEDRVANRTFFEKLNTPLGVECFREVVGGTEQNPAPPTARITLTDEISRDILACYDARSAA